MIKKRRWALTLKSLRVKPITQFLLLSLICFLFCGIGLGLAVSRGIRSHDWLPRKAEITSSYFGGRSARRTGIGWHRVRVDYTFENTQYNRRVDRFGTRENSQRGKIMTVYVNPNLPTELASAQGFLAIDYGIPLVGTLGSLAFSVVILCILYSPKDDYESEVNESLI